MIVENAVSWRRALLPAGSTVQDAIRCLDQSALRIVLVVAAGDVLLGSVTDGDIRRALLRGMDLASLADDVMCTSPFVVPPGMPRDTVQHLMAVNRLLVLPVVDAEQRVVGLHQWEELASPARRENPMVIMAGGLGMRLRPHTTDCPKPMLPVAGKPMLEHIICRARDDGFYRFIISINYLGHLIEAHFGDGARFGVNITYLREETPLGTAGALSLLDPIGDMPVVVANGDVLTDVRYADILEFHNRNAAQATMAVRLYEWQHPFGVVRTEGMFIVGFEEKPTHRTHVNAGIYVLDPSAIAKMRPGEKTDMPTVFEVVRRAGGVSIAYPMHEPWLDVGRPADLDLARTTKWS